MSRPKPFTFQAAQDAARTQALANADAPRYAPSGRAVAWVPTLTAGVTPITVPVEPWGRYVQINNLVEAWFEFDLTGVAGFGGGDFVISTPTPMIANPVGLTFDKPCGRWMADHFGGAPPRSLAAGDLVVFPGTSSAYPIYQSGAGVFVRQGLAAATPWAWTGAGAGDRLSGFLSYLCPDGFTP